MLKHQILVHDGEDPPDFVMRVIKSSRTALERQVGEAVRIRRRGGEGAILNSKSEYLRCHIPRLQLEDKATREQREEDIRKMEEQIAKMMEQNEEEWKRDKLRAREAQIKIPRAELATRNIQKSKPVIRKKKEDDIFEEEEDLSQRKGRRPKKLRFSKASEKWGEMEEP